MATSITISVGPLSRSRTFQDDTKASAALLLFRDAYNLGPDATTNGEKLDSIIDWIVETVEDVSIQYYMESLRAANKAEAEALYRFNNGN